MAEKPEQSMGAQVASAAGSDPSLAARVEDLVASSEEYDNVRAVLVAHHGKTVVES